MIKSTLKWINKHAINLIVLITYLWVFLNISGLLIYKSYTNDRFHNVKEVLIQQQEQIYKQELLIKYLYMMNGIQVLPDYHLQNKKTNKDTLEI